MEAADGPPTATIAITAATKVLQYDAMAANDEARHSDRKGKNLRPV